MHVLPSTLSHNTSGAHAVFFLSQGCASKGSGAHAVFFQASGHKWNAHNRKTNAILAGASADARDCWCQQAHWSSVGDGERGRAASVAALISRRQAFTADSHSRFEMLWSVGSGVRGRPGPTDLRSICSYSGDRFTAATPVSRLSCFSAQLFSGFCAVRLMVVAPGASAAGPGASAAVFV